VNLDKFWRKKKILFALEPDRRYAISSPTSAEERKPDRRFAYANPTLVQRRQADADLQPTITTFYRRWFDVTLQTGIGPYGYGVYNYFCFVFVLIFIQDLDWEPHSIDVSLICIQIKKE
jgi:hypothetical protein